MILSIRPSAGAPRAAAAAPTEPVDFGVLLNIAFGVFKDRLHAHLAGAGFSDLGPSFGYVFRSLADGPLSLAQLAARLGISSQGALKIVAEMEALGYVQRRDDASDQRVRRVALAPRGRSALREARRFHADEEQRLATSLGERRVANARAVLEALAAGALDAASRSVARPF